VSTKALLSELEKASKTALQNRHRFMVVLCTSELSDRVFKLVKNVYQSYQRVVDRDDLLVVGRSPFLEIVKKYFAGKFLHYKDSTYVLGETYSSLILDFTEGFHPNDLGILVETVAEGGLIIAISPPITAWEKLIGKWQEDIISEPYSVADIIPRFFRRFIERTYKADGIIVFDIDKRKIVKKYEFRKMEESREEVQLPTEEKEIKKKLYKLCATQDQVRVLQLFETYFDRKKERKAVIITADRGRGKTAVLGILTPYLISRMHRVFKRPVRVMVVAPTPHSIQMYFRFLKKALVRQGMKDFRVKESDGITTVLNSKFARVEYVVPRRAMVDKEYADIIIVDEAASIDVPVLWKITEGARYTIFSSTVHGYEGAGRGFSIRFLRRLESDENTEIEKIHLVEPVRYGKGDPIEAWLYDVLLLDAQPAELDEDDFAAVEAGKLSFEMLDRDRLFSDEKLLREFFGIYVLAHYRNRPSDVVILGDMPNHLAFRVAINGKTVCSLHVAIEGEIDREVMEKMANGYKPRGQIIPDLILKHYWDYEFPMLKGIRIVRIATHPSMMNRGIGSFALQKVVEWAKSQKLDWIGSGFGVSPELLRFWTKNGFLPVHITPQRNETSGEYTLIVLKALKVSIQSKVERINADFIRRVIDYLSDELRDLETETAIGLLHSLVKNAAIPEPTITSIERKRLGKYFDGISFYEYISDIARPLVRYYYSRTDRVLEADEEKVLVAKCLQLKSWWEIKSDIKENTKVEDKVFKVLMKAIEKVWGWYANENKL
jgi:tRNA(Met) cytidine acetyltransferase